MFVTYVNAIIWCAITGWLFPGAFWYMVGFWAVLIVILLVSGIGFWEINDSYSSSDSRKIDVTIDGKKYSGTVHKKDD